MLWGYHTIFPPRKYTQDEADPPPHPSDADDDDAADNDADADAVDNNVEDDAESMQTTTTRCR